MQAKLEHLAVVAFRAKAYYEALRRLGNNSSTHRLLIKKYERLTRILADLSVDAEEIKRIEDRAK